MTAPQSQSGAPSKKHRFRFSLRSLFIFVALLATGLGIWTQHMRWYVARLANPETAEAAFDSIMELHAATRPPELRDNVMARRKVLREQGTRRFNAWPQRPGRFLPGYVWVREEGVMYAVSPLGETNLGGIVLNGPPPEVLWNGTLPDGRPGIVVFNNVTGPFGNEGYLICISTRRVPTQDTELTVVRLQVHVERPDVTAELLPGATTPTIVLRSHDGNYAEEFEFPHGESHKSEDEPAKTLPPWQLRTRG